MLFMYILQQKEQCNAMHTHTYTHTTCKKRDARKQGHTEGSDSHGKQRKGGERKEANQAHRQTYGKTHTHTQTHTHRHTHTHTHTQSQAKMAWRTDSRKASSTENSPMLVASLRPERARMSNTEGSMLLCRSWSQPSTTSGFHICTDSPSACNVSTDAFMSSMRARPDTNAVDDKMPSAASSTLRAWIQMYARFHSSLRAHCSLNISFSLSMAALTSGHTRRKMAGSSSSRGSISARGLDIINASRSATVSPSSSASPPPLLLLLLLVVVVVLLLLLLLLLLVVLLLSACCASGCNLRYASQ